MPPPVLFADTFYWVAVLSPRDPFHARVMSWGRNLGRTRLVTTDEVLTEVLAFCSAEEALRIHASKAVRRILSVASVRVIPQSLYGIRPNCGFVVVELCIFDRAPPSRSGAYNRTRWALLLHRGAGHDFVLWRR